jgi:hypothetical protein
VNRAEGSSCAERKAEAAQGGREGLLLGARGQPCGARWTGLRARRGLGPVRLGTPAFVARCGFCVGVERVAGDVVVDGLQD